MSKTDLFDLSGKVSVVTGAGSGLGRIFSETLAEHGSHVVCADINLNWAKETSDMLVDYDVKALAMEVDVSNPDSVGALFRRVDQEFGKLDVLFNNAGISAKGTRIHEMQLEQWNRVINVNLTGTLLCMQEGLKIMLRQKSGSIINISSILGLTAIDPNILSNPHYIASKHGIIGLTKAAAAQYGPDNIRVNAISPGFYKGTRLPDTDKRTPEQSKIAGEMILSQTPLRRVATPEELKGLSVMLASDKASGFITGAVFVSDGGWCAQ